MKKPDKNRTISLIIFKIKQELYGNLKNIEN
jgi:hypothetical protein